MKRLSSVSGVFEKFHKQRKNMSTQRRFTKTVIWLSIIASLSALIVVYVKSEILLADQKEYADYYSKYYVLLASLLIFSVLSLWLRTNTALNLVIVMCSVVATLYVVEFVLYFNGWTKPLHPNIVKAEGGIKPQNILVQHIITKLRNQGVEPIRSLPGGQLDRKKVLVNGELRLALGGKSKSTVVFCGTGTEFVTYLSDRHGFNNPDGEWAHPDINGLLIGDSFTQGYCVKPGEDIAGRLRQISGNSFINLGVEGTGPLHQLATLIEYGIKVKPKVVFWIYYERNDLGDLLLEKNEPLLMQYLKDEFTQNLIHFQDEIDVELDISTRFGSYSGTNEIQDSKKRSEETQSDSESRKSAGKSELRVVFNRLKRIAVLSNLRWVTGFDNIGKESVNLEKHNVEVFGLLEQILDTAHTFSSGLGSKFYFVYLPAYERYLRPFTNHERLFQRKEILDVVKKLGIPLIDIHKKVFLEHSNPRDLFPLIPGHYNTEGYKRVANVLASEVEERID